MTRNKNTHEQCIVIGAGIIGVVTAYRLLQNGFSVTLIDKTEPGPKSGQCCSYGNAGHFAPEQIFPLPSPSLRRQIPAMMLNPDSPLTVRPSHYLPFLPWAISFLWHCRKAPFDRGTAALKDLNRLALADWKVLLKDTGQEKYLKTQGTLEVFKTPKGRARGMIIRDNLARHGIASRLLSPTELKDRVPAISPDQQGALFYPDGGHCINPFGLLQNIYDKFRKKGGKFLSGEALAIQKISSTETRVNMAGNSLTATNVFICAGLESKSLVNSLGYHVPLTAERGYHIMLPRPGIDLDYALTYHERKFIITPMEDGIRLAGTVEFAHKDSPPNYDRARMLKKFSREILPNLSDHSSDQWMGCRPTLPDYLPIIDHQDNIYFAFGHNHLGLTQAATTAKILTNMMPGQSTKTQPSTTLPNPFRINRF